ncbi:alpha/beta fold hydrolase [Mesobacillus subterraneus]|uniref:Alpha/beta hydrolase n=1 Tax=Mesobacillus subterraneus TaxID=285983 RepID=A0A427TNY8_9BACI|nr:alpha/beta hydrolase [Mesobacillus subterraneus]RSD26090.1 alpha/beta hydrolase [Mesobacillus subterraneus]
MESKSLHAGNTEISFYDQGSGKPVVLVHGFAGSKLYWEKVLPELAVQHRVIALDLPGHGESGMGQEKYSIEEMAGVIKDMIEQLGLEKVTMFGHSLGGYITLAFAELYPKYLNGFSLVHSTANPDSEEAKAARGTNADKVQAEGPKEFIDGLSKKLFAPDYSEAGAQDIAEAAEIGMKTSIKGMVSALLAMRDRANRNHVLEKTGLPVLLIAGEQDQIVPPEKSFTVEKPNIGKYIIEGSGHMSMYEKPDDLVQAMKGFLEKI